MEFRFQNFQNGTALKPTAEMTSDFDWFWGRETPGQWLPPSLTFDIRHSQIKREDSPQLITKHWLANGRHVDLPDGHRTLANLTGRSIVSEYI